LLHYTTVEDPDGSGAGAGSDSRRASTTDSCEIETLTVDKYQGRDKPCVILSLVRSNAQGNAGRLLSDWQRINVALTRAKHKLVLVGCAESLRPLPMLGALLDEVDRRGWRLKLASEAAGGGEVSRP